MRLLNVLQQMFRISKDKKHKKQTSERTKRLKQEVANEVKSQFHQRVEELKINYSSESC